ncbi:NTP transferase domain-containing protein [Lutibacter maritimus]|uniref:Molybdenum cofactor cytidylyltransferase n=1 Tax=Lutibacter maritimus TaxID=593133 RepID=A0A1I6S9S3_9FLAO|nr:NTP transferase domain-containing protein [Lutibacter maritimus]SFS73725.1 molybdenum cofactor cytidylyltransferase [Lutibacter maritimus]
MKNKPVFVLLAGGKSERMGTDKGLLKFNNNYWILEQLNRISNSTIQKIYIGLGFHSQHYFEAIPWLKDALVDFVSYQNLNIKVIINNTPELGSFSTLQTILKEVTEKSTIILNHIDIPILNVTELIKIISTENNVVIPIFEGKKGHPIKMKPAFWTNLISINATEIDARLDYQLKKINPIKISTVEVFDRTVILNLNTKKDWNTFLENQ